MEDFFVVIIALFIISLPVWLGIWCLKIAERKNRSKFGWFCVGFFFGVIGLIIALCVGEVYPPCVATPCDRVVVQTQPPTSADELAKLRWLLDTGTLTYEEYEIEKQKILRR